jgi:hypothetical protein
MFKCTLSVSLTTDQLRQLIAALLFLDWFK